MDRRLTPANARVAASFLEGQVKAERFSDGTRLQLKQDAFLFDAPGGRRDRQLLIGDDFQLYEESEDGWAFGQSLKDGYVGYVQDALATPLQVTHRVSARTSWAYPDADFKSPTLMPLHLNSRVQLREADGKWARLLVTGLDQEVFLPAAHLSPLTSPKNDPTHVAEAFLGTPYVWAGNSGFGIDCSGLVQAALLACNIPCPADSDLQESALGQALPEGASLVRGDLLFWKGHVAMVVDEERLIHANAHHMAVAYEGIDEAIDRIRAQGDGQVTARKRL